MVSQFVGPLLLLPLFSQHEITLETACSCYYLYHVIIIIVLLLLLLYKTITWFDYAKMRMHTALLYAVYIYIFVYRRYLHVICYLNMFVPFNYCQYINLFSVPRTHRLLFSGLRQNSTHQFNTLPPCWSSGGTQMDTHRLSLSLPEQFETVAFSSDWGLLQSCHCILMFLL